MPSSFWLKIGVALAGALALLGVIVKAFLTGQRVAEGDHAQANLKAAQEAKNVRERVDGRPDADLDRDLSKWVRPKK